MSYSRRQFLKTAGIVTIGSMATKNSVWGAQSPRMFNNSNTLRVGLIGCGGRGTGAAEEALNADPNVVLYAMADAFSDRLESSYNSLKGKLNDKVQVSDNNKFVGLDAYQRLLETDVDVVLLAAPSAFRPDRKSTRLNSSHVRISYAVFCLK